MKRVQPILQADRSECGLACIAMVAAHHGHRASLHEHRSKLRISQRGTSLRRLSGFAERLGFRCRAVRLELDELPQLHTPAILHWTLDHFVVLESTGRRAIRVVDPAVGARRITWEEADAAFTGVALELEPTTEFKPREQSQEIPLTAFMASFRGLAATISGVFALTVALQIFALVMPLNTQFTVDQAIRASDPHLAVVLAVGFGLLGLTSATTSYLRALLIQYVGSSSAFRMVAGLLHHMIRLPDAWFEARHTGDVMSRFESTEPIRYFLATGAFTLLVDTAMALGALGVLLVYSWRLALAACAFVALFAALRLGTYRPLRNDSRRIATDHLRRQLGVVMQDDDLFSGSIAENVAVGDAVDLVRIEAACRHACIHEDVMAMPMQYLTLVGHMGSTLSGGQRQRLMIARAVYRTPRIIVFDEATAHLNDALQQRVLANLRRLRVTIVSVTHDPRVLDQADRVVRLQANR